MGNLYENIEALCIERGIKGGKMCTDLGISKGLLTDLKMGRRSGVSAKTADKIASYFGVTVGYLLGTENRASVTGSDAALPNGTEIIDLGTFHRIPILGRISAGLPLYAEEHIEGYTLTDLNGGAEYFALRVSGDSMNAARIQDGDVLIVRRQDEVENGEVAVVMVGDEDATVKRFYATGSTVTLMPQSTNPEHQPQIYDTSKTKIRVIGRVVKVEFTL